MIRYFGGDDPPPGWDDGDDHDGAEPCIDHDDSGCEDCQPCPRGCGLTTVVQGADHCASYCEACVACDCPPNCVGCNGCEAIS